MKTRLKIIKGKFLFVPLIDVIFLLLIFFVLSSAFIQISAINVRLPAATGQLINAKKTAVTIDKNNKFYFNDQLVTLKTLKQQLANITAKYQIKSIIIRADKDAAYGTITKMLTLANSLNLNVYLAVKTIPTAKPVAIETD